MRNLASRIYWFLYFSLFAMGMVKFSGNIYLSHVVFFALIFAAVASRMVEGALPLPRLQLILAGFFSMAALISLYVNSSSDAIKYIAQVGLFYTGIFFSSVAINSNLDMRRWVLGTVLGCTITAVAGFVQSIQWIMTNGLVFIAQGEFFRVKGFSATPGEYATILMVGLYASSLIERVLYRRILVGFYVFLLLISMSRSGLVIIFMAAAIFIFQGLRDRKQAPRILGGFLVLLIIMFASGMLEVVLKRAEDIGNINYNIKRYVTYEYILGRIFSSTSSFLFGNGFGTFRFYHPVDQAWYNNPHNIYLYIFYCTGLFGFVFFFAGVAFLVKQSLRLWYSRPDYRTLLKAVLMIHLCTWVMGLVETNIVGVGCGWVLGMVFGIPLAVEKMNSQV